MDNLIFENSRKYNLYFKRSKCDFNIKEILIIGVVIGKGTSPNRRRKNQDSKRIEDAD